MDASAGRSGARPNSVEQVCRPVYVGGMTLIDELPAAATDVLRRRAEAAAVPMWTQVRRELIALARRRAPIDDVVDFLRAQRPGWAGSGDPSAVREYELPVDVRDVLTDRAHAAGLPADEYVHNELARYLRRGSVRDSILEFREVLGGDETRAGELAEISAAIRYARGE